MDRTISLLYFQKKLRENKFLAVKQSPKKCRNSSQQLRSENQQLNSSTLSCELYTYSISAYLIYAQTLFVGILVATYKITMVS